MAVAVKIKIFKEYNSTGYTIGYKTMTETSKLFRYNYF